MVRFYWRCARGWLSELQRRLTERVTLGLLDRMGDAPRQDGARTRVLFDFQGRKLRGRMEELGLTIGDLAERTGIDRVSLVAVLFGQEEMGASSGPGSPRRWTCSSPGCSRRPLRPADQHGWAGFCEIEPAEGEPAGATHPPDHPSDGLGGDPR